MSRTKWDISTALKEFYRLLKRYPDEPQYLLVFTNYIRQFLRCDVQDHSLPTVEVMTVLKHEKPIIFTLMRRQKNSIFAFLTHIEMDLEEARKRINELTKIT